MSWLHSILKSLTPAEFDQVSSIKLKGQEKRVFDCYIQHLEAASDIDVPSLLNISESHVYKISSLLIKKISDKISNNNVQNYITLLKEKALYPILKNEINLIYKKSTKLLIHQKNKQELLFCFWTLIDLPYLFYDEKLVEKISTEYLSIFKDEELNERKEYIRFHKLFAFCNRCTVRKNPAKSFGYSITDLETFEKELKSGSNYLAMYYLYRTFCSYYSYYEKNPDQNLVYIKKAIELKDHIAHHFPIDIATFLNLQYADALQLAQKQDEAYAIYDLTFKKPINDTMYGYYYYCEQYSMLALQFNNFSKVRSILETHFAAAIKEKKDIYATRGLLTWCKLNLTIGSYKEALSNIVNAKKINDKSVYIPFDLQLRVLETFCFFLKKDHDFTRQLCVRNIKFIQAQEGSQEMTEYVRFFKSILGVVNCYEKNKIVSDEFIDQLTELETIFKPIFGNLINITIKSINEKN